MSPRRSSRARSSQQPPSAPNHSNSTTSINSKPERDPRTNIRANSPRRPSTQRSGSVPSADSNPRVEQLPPRRSRRNGEEKEPAVKQQVDNSDENNEAEAIEEEVTRCICGQAEYPGPSPAVGQPQSPPTTTSDALTDDTGNFFVQCDKCGVWQHGGCMGLFDESMLPEEYYCEQCKPGYHRITKTSSGLRSSRYLPVVEAASARSSPLSSAHEQPRKKANKNKISESTKRRATMNSRGAYDEDEMLRRAIEESRENGTLGKRARDDTEDQKANPKRQRTGSNSSSTVSKHSGSSEPDLDDGTGHRGRKCKNRVSTSKSSCRTNQSRKGGARQAEGATSSSTGQRRPASEMLGQSADEEKILPLRPQAYLLQKQHQSNGKEKADTPPSGRSNSNRKNGKTACEKRQARRNQYTRDQANGDERDTPGRDFSHDANGNGGSPPGVNGINGESGRSSKAKTHPARTSLNEMK